MFLIDLVHVFLLLTVVTSVNSSFRKIRDGKQVEGFMNFMVYLTKADKSDTKYDAWICGGSIVTKDFILTSAACVQDVQYMYAIAGYNKYVNTKDIESDPCTKESKKKIVLICVPKAYDFDYNKIEKWAFIDIALVRVESPYDFTATTPLGSCTHVPNKIEINYEVKYQLPNTDAMILGWGHKEKWRTKADKTDYNQELLQYSSILVMDKAECKIQYNTNETQQLLHIIDKYMICAMNEGNINDKGELIKKTAPTADGCPSNLRVGGVCQEAQSYQQPNSQLQNQNPIPYNPMPHNPITHNPIPHNPMLQNPITIPLNPNPMSAPQYNYNRQQGVNLNQDSVTFEDIIMNRRRNSKNETTFNYTRKAGICQNDHGGPLITWVGKHERLIGVASVFRVASDMSCVGPYLFTSTQCNSAFIECCLNEWGNKKESGSEKKTKLALETTDPPYPLRRTNQDFCDLPPEKKGFDIIKRRISWRNHPKGPAANEIKEDLFYRPVRPLRP